MAASSSAYEAVEDGEDTVQVRHHTVLEYSGAWVEPAGKGTGRATTLSPMQAVLGQMQRLADIDESIGKRSEAQQKTLDKVVSMYDRTQKVSVEKLGRIMQPGDEGWRP